jgi:hypothetical protein
MKEIADAQGYLSHIMEANEGRTLPALLAPGLRSILLQLNRLDQAKQLARRGLRILKSFLGGLQVKVGDVEIGLTIEPEAGTADSGDLEADLPELLLAVAESARAAGRPVVLLIDELQYLSEEEFSALIMGLHRVSQAKLALTMIGAGLPQILGLAGSSKSYAERLFRYPRIGALTEDDARLALSHPAEEEGAAFEADALAEILRITERYPYFLQQWGYDAWNVAESEIISLGDVHRATNVAIRTLDESFFRVRLDRCTNSEKQYLRALAELGSGSHRSGEIADILRVKTTSVAPVRSYLIKKGMIYSPSYGDTAFTVPLFDAFMRRALPLR